MRYNTSIVNRNTLFIHLAVYLFGLAGVAGQLSRLPVPIIVGGRLLFAVMALGFLWLTQKKTSTTLSANKKAWLLVSGVLLFFHWYSFFKAIQLSSVAIGLLAYATYPLFTLIIDIVTKSSPIKVIDILSIILVFTGIAILSFPSRILFASQGIVWGVLSGLSFAILSKLNQQSAIVIGAVSTALVQYCIAFMISLFFIPFGIVSKLSLYDWILLFIMGTILTAFSHTLFIYALKRVRVLTASLIACMEPVYGTTAAWLLLREHVNMYIIASGILIILSSILQSISIANSSPIDLNNKKVLDIEKQSL